MIDKYNSQKNIETNYQIGNVQPNLSKKDLRISGTSEVVAAYLNALEYQGIHINEKEVKRLLRN
jgi:hypothetical protein